MISRTRKKVDEPESDSDWDSLPGDVPEPNSSPEPNIKTATASSLSPSPPKHSNTYGAGKHTATKKPVNLYKTATNSSKKSTGNATAFEDRSGGIWNDDDEDIKTDFSKESKSNDYNKNDQSYKVLKQTKETRNVQQQETEKRPPFTDFHDALTTPISSSQNRNNMHHKQAGVNQAYKTEKEDIHTSNHDSWDENENVTTSELSQTHEHQKAEAMKHSETRNPVQISIMNKQDKNDFQPPAMDLVHSDPDSQFQNCCLLQVAHGPHDDRYRPSFFHGSKNHFHISEDNPRATVTEIAEKSEVVLQRFWREVFGVLQILLNFFTIFILEFLKVMVHSLRYLITGILYIIGDHFIKPLLSAIFNNIIQPFSILLLNIFTIFSNLLKPLLYLTRELLSQISIPLKAFRLFELKWDHRKKQNSECTDIKVV